MKKESLPNFSPIPNDGMLFQGNHYRTKRVPPAVGWSVHFNRFGISLFTGSSHFVVASSIPVTIQGVYLCSLFCRYKAVCDTLGLQNDHQKIYLVYILGSTGFLQNDLVFLQGQHGKKTPNKTSYVNPRMHFVGFSNSRQTWGII